MQEKPSPQAMNELAALFNERRHIEAEAVARAMTVRFPAHGFGWKALGTVLRSLGRGAEALVVLKKATDLLPGDAEAHNNLGNALRDQGLLYEAEASFRRALQIRPAFAEAHNNLGATLRDSGRLDEAVASYRRALQIKPDYAEAHNHLGNALHDSGRLDEAEASYRRALQIKPGFAEADNNLGATLRDLGRLDEAVVSYRRALQIKPDYAAAHGNLLFLYAYRGLLDWREYLEQARAWEKSCLSEQERQAARGRSFARSPLAGRRLRVGYVSGDYRQHAASYFLERLFACHDRTRVEVFAYRTNSSTDAVTERIQRSVEHWVSLVGLSDADARERVEADAIDVLIDLSGHTANNRLGIFARRAAPVQAHYLGYFASTGLAEMDYWIGDEILTPKETDSHFTETLWRLPRVWVAYEGKSHAPAPDWHPATDGTVWLGSFNNLGKLTPQTLGLWARVLHALPEGRLLLKTRELADAGNRQRILDVMTGYGIASDRIELRDRSVTPDWAAHMAYYNRLDIALDPVGGVAGGTTTCDALWMGVPVIALAGERMATRMTGSMLAAIGHREWCAESEEDYIGKVVSLARNVDRRRELRDVQRQQMAQSSLCDSVDLARCLEDAYAAMFERRFERRNEQQSTTL